MGAVKLPEGQTFFTMEEERMVLQKEKEEEGFGGLGLNLLTGGLSYKR